MSKAGAVISADLGTSSNHSNEKTYLFFFKKISWALKTVVEKVSLKLANMQGLVGPKR